VLAHIDFFQNNLMFRATWDEDFAGQALADKRSIAMIRSEKDRWVDYIIEFTRGIDNLVDLFGDLPHMNRPAGIQASGRIDYYFDVFLQTLQKVSPSIYMKEIERHNSAIAEYGPMAESAFCADTTPKYPEFEALYEKQKREKKVPVTDIIQCLQDNAPFLQRSENLWMKTIMEIVRRTSLTFSLRSGQRSSTMGGEATGTTHFSETTIGSGAMRYPMLWSTPRLRPCPAWASTPIPLA
jgi:stage V sporulation protein R